MPKAETTKKSTKAATSTSTTSKTSRGSKAASKGSSDAKPAKKQKAKKDPNAPKKPLSAYMFFSQDWRDRVKTESPDATFGETGKILGAKWKELSESDKKPYHDMAARDKKRYEAEKETYESNPAGDEEDDDE